MTCQSDLTRTGMRTTLKLNLRFAVYSDVASLVTTRSGTLTSIVCAVGAASRMRAATAALSGSRDRSPMRTSVPDDSVNVISPSASFTDRIGMGRRTSLTVASALTASAESSATTAPTRGSAVAGNQMRGRSGRGLRGGLAQHAAGVRHHPRDRASAQQGDRTLRHDAHDERVGEIAVVARRRDNRYRRQSAIAVGGIERQQARSCERLESGPYAHGHTGWNAVDLDALDREHRRAPCDCVHACGQKQRRHADQH